MGPLHEDVFTFMIISHLIINTINASDKSHRNNQNTCSMLNSFFPENHAVYEIMLKNLVELDRVQMTIWRICIACKITMAKIQTRTQKVQYLLLFHGNNGHANVP